jgi:glycosyltransferase involved in cell wall biosynthesis
MINDSTPKISVIVPVYNAEKYLERCINSILCQTFKFFECILIDDCSTDNSLVICNNYANKDERVKVYHKKKNGGISQARKTGITLVNAKYTLFIDNDDWIEPIMLEELYIKMESENYDIVCSDVYHEFDEGTIYANQDPGSDSNIELIKKIIMWENFLPVTWNKLIRTDIYKKINFPNASYSEDRGIMVQILYFSQKIGYINKSFYHWCHIQSSLSRKKKNMIKNLIDDYTIYIVILCFIMDNITDSDEYINMIFSYIYNNIGFLCFDNRDFLDVYKRSVDNIVKAKKNNNLTNHKIKKEQKKVEIIIKLLNMKINLLNEINIIECQIKKIVPQRLKNVIKKYLLFRNNT